MLQLRGGGGCSDPSIAFVCQFVCTVPWAPGCGRFGRKVGWIVFTPPSSAVWNGDESTWPGSGPAVMYSSVTDWELKSWTSTREQAHEFSSWGTSPLQTVWFYLSTGQWYTPAQIRALLGNIAYHGSLLLTALSALEGTRPLVEAGRT